jgi:serine-type D-Ala-D-Ala carboxypeptidase/endopeptidase (penicillin-binding protein 4)
MPTYRQICSVILFWIPALLLYGCSSARYAGESKPAVEGRHMPSVSPLPALKANIDGLLPDSLFPPSNAGIMVVSLADGRSLYELNPDLYFMPASNEKLFTSAAALTVLKPDYRFLTSVSVDTTDVPTIYVRGSGDPLLATADLDSLARTVASLLPQNRSWLLGGDVSLFDDVPWGEGWMWDDEADPDGMAITPLSLNGNTVHVQVRGGDNPGDTLTVTVEPETGYVTVENRGVTAIDTTSQALQVTRRLTDPSSTILVTGSLRPRDTSSSRISVREPAWYTLRVLAERLATYGVHCTGMVLDTLPVTARPLCNLYHTLDSVVTNMNRVSDNLSAECLLKTMGAITQGAPGTAAAGISAIKQCLTGQGLDTTSMIIADGSGVSRYNLNTARNIAELLRMMYRNQAAFPLFYKSLPGPGERGSLSGRMRGTSAEGNLRAKTGTLRGATAFSGYVTAADGKMLAFSVIMQNFHGNLRSYRQIQDRIGVFLSQWKE